MSDPKRFLSADEVIQQLGINKATLYSYVSRGTIRSEETEGKSRRRRYFAEDVEALLKRKEDRRNPERVAESALQWGDPVFESAITLIEKNRLYYRGVDALELACSQSFEAVAMLLWNKQRMRMRSFEARIAFDSNGSTLPAAGAPCPAAHD